MAYTGIQPVPRATVRKVEGELKEASNTIEVQGGYPVGQIDLYIEGRLIPHSEFQAVDGATIQLKGNTLSKGTPYTVNILTPFETSDFYTKEESDKLFSNPNLITNSEFLIWQRGRKEYTVNGYTADRWTFQAAGSSSVIKPSEQNYESFYGFTHNMPMLWNVSSVTTESKLIHRIEKPERFAFTDKLSFSCEMQSLEEKTVRIYARIWYDNKLTKDWLSKEWLAFDIAPEGTLVEHTFELKKELLPELLKGEAENRFITIELWRPGPECFHVKNGEFDKFGDVTKGNIAVKWIKLEIGDKCTPYQCNDYQEQLIKCKRFFNKRTFRMLALTDSNTTGVRYVEYNFPTKMRKTPSLNIIKVTTDNGTSDTISPSSINLNPEVMSVQFRVASNGGFVRIDEFELDAEL